MHLEWAQLQQEVYRSGGVECFWLLRWVPTRKHQAGRCRLAACLHSHWHAKLGHTAVLHY